MVEQLQKLHLTQFEILKVIDNICCKNNIKYSLYAGTLLGAVRHKGFIPWDDDLDVCMSRDEYDRFIELWTKNPPEGYILQNKDNAPGFTQSFTKITKNHTTFLSSYGECVEGFHAGIFVDIFPIDHIPNGKMERCLFFWRCMRYQLYTREFIPPKENLAVKMVSKIFLTIVPKNKRKKHRKNLENKILKYNRNKQLSTVSIETVATMVRPLPPSLLDEFTSLEFEGEKFMCFKAWDEYLTLRYQDYMQFPIEEERVWKHHPVLLDFEHNYEEVIK